ncbi:MAG: YihY family inner membrane protein [Proteobacteria bacterium]|nr:YihY family inner membrane protein [Pseudomonadota bacterium]
MQPSVFLRRWMQGFDRERARAFIGFLWRRFIDDDCLSRASALAFTSLLALVPLTATLLGVVAMLPVSAHWGDALTAFLFRHFVPGAASSISRYVREFAHSARSLTGLGTLGVLVTALLTMASVEDAFGRIWRVPVPRRALARFAIYCLALVFGPLIGVMIVAVSSYVFSLPAMVMAEKSTLARFGLHLLPVLLEWLAFASVYRIVPNRGVRSMHALAGGLLAAVLFEGAKYGIALYLGYASYQKIYGAMAAMPIFLLWLWLSWLMVLLGASFTAALASFRYMPVAMRLPRGAEFYALLRLLGRFEHARVRGRGLHSEQLHALEPILDDDLLQRLLGALAAAGLVVRDARGRWELRRDLDDLDLLELHEAVGLPVPLGNCVLPCSDDALGQRVLAALETLRRPLREHMRRSVGSIYAAQSSNPTEQPGA